MSRYRHTQLAPLLSGAVVLTAAALAVAAAHAPPSQRWALAAGAVLTSAAAYLFSSLTTEVDGREVRLHFGPGFWRKRYPLAEVESAEAVRNSPLYGWGIRLTPHGWLYNVSGLDAVELRLQGGRRVRIGTDDPGGLRDAIRGAEG